MNKNKKSLREIITLAVEYYNRTRSPEATAKVVDINEKEGIVTVEFRGSFCLTCGIVDWVEDFAYIIKSMGYDAKLLKYIEPEDDILKRFGIFKIEISKEYEQP